MSWFGNKTPDLREVYTDIYDVLAWQEAVNLLKSKRLELCDELPSLAWTKVYNVYEYLNKHLNNHYKEIFS